MWRLPTGFLLLTRPPCSSSSDTLGTRSWGGSVARFRPFVGPIFFCPLIPPPLFRHYIGGSAFFFYASLHLRFDGVPRHWGVTPRGSGLCWFHSFSCRQQALLFFLYIGFFRRLLLLGSHCHGPLIYLSPAAFRWGILRFVLLRSTGVGCTVCGTVYTVLQPAVFWVYGHPVLAS